MMRNGTQVQPSPVNYFLHYVTSPMLCFLLCYISNRPSPSSFTNFAELQCKCKTGLLTSVKKHFFKFHYSVVFFFFGKSTSTEYQPNLYASWAFNHLCHNKKFNYSANRPFVKNLTNDINGGYFLSN